MKVHEYQAKEILARYGVPTPTGRRHRQPGGGAPDREGARRHASSSRRRSTPAGAARGAASSSPKNPDEAVELREEDHRHDSSSRTRPAPRGARSRRCSSRRRLDIARELYLGITLDRAIGMPVLMASKFGGMEIEEVAAQGPEGDPEGAVRRDRRPPARSRRASSPSRSACRARRYKKARRLPARPRRRPTSRPTRSLAEINPLLDHERRATSLALDAKMNFDDNALFRHPDIEEMRDLDEEDPLEVEASKFNLNYIKLDGNVGCMVNGAGLAMATMDIIKHAGGSPANFLDVGGGANEEQVKNAFRIILSDPNVKAVLINIFGGIMRCDIIASGRRRGGQGDRLHGPRRRPPRGDERRGGQGDPARLRARRHPGRRDGGRRGEGRRRGREGGELRWRSGSTRTPRPRPGPHRPRGEVPRASPGATTARRSSAA